MIEIINQGCEEAEEQEQRTRGGEGVQEEDFVKIKERRRRA